VPFLVASPYTGTYNSQSQTYGTYVSGACGASPLPSCPNYGTPTDPHLYVHDFGSILAFVEYNFQYPEFIAQPYYADYNAPDWGGSPPNNTNVPLSDFFGLYPSQRPFVPITTDKPYTWFKNANNNEIPGYPGAPDED
jgi:hypothetical protein